MYRCKHISIPATSGGPNVLFPFMLSCRFRLTNKERRIQSRRRTLWWHTSRSLLDLASMVVVGALKARGADVGSAGTAGRVTIPWPPPRHPWCAWEPPRRRTQSTRPRSKGASKHTRVARSFVSISDFKYKRFLFRLRIWVECSARLWCI